MSFYVFIVVIMNRIILRWDYHHYHFIVAVINYVVLRGFLPLSTLVHVGLIILYFYCDHYNHVFGIIGIILVYFSRLSRYFCRGYCLSYCISIVIIVNHFILWWDHSSYRYFDFYNSHHFYVGKIFVIFPFLGIIIINRIILCGSLTNFCLFWLWLLSSFVLS